MINIMPASHHPDLRAQLGVINPVQVGAFPMSLFPCSILKLKGETATVALNIKIHPEPVPAGRQQLLVQGGAVPSPDPHPGISKSVFIIIMHANPVNHLVKANPRYIYLIKHFSISRTPDPYISQMPLILGILNHTGRTAQKFF